MKYALLFSACLIFFASNLYGQGGYFQVTGSLNESRQFDNNHDISAILLNDGKVLVSGGVPGTGNAGAGYARITAEQYDPSTGTWSYIGSLNIARVGHVLTLLNDNRVLVTGGHASSITGAAFYNSAEIYDPLANVHSLLGVNMVEKRSRHVSVKLDNGKVLIAGGHNEAGPHASAEIYDPNTNTFTLTGSMNVNRGAGHTATLLDDGKVLIIGNSGGIDAEIYDPSSGIFTITGNMSFPRNVHTATKLLDGKVLVVGGSFGGQARNSAEIYDPTTGMFTLISDNMSTPRRTHTATVLNDGRVLIVGGSSGQFASALETAEIFDPLTETFQPVGPLTTGRFEHKEVRLQDGRVLIIGGAYDTGFGSIALASTELFQLEDISNNIVGYWPFCGDANDESGNGNDGTVFGATQSEDRFGNPNSSYSFDGSDDYILVSNSPSLNLLSEGTISFWFSPGENVTSSNSIQRHFLSREYGGHMLGDIEIIFDDRPSLQGKISVELEENTAAYTISSNSDNWLANNWYFFSFTWGSSGMKMYIDGQLQTDTDAYSGPVGSQGEPDFTIGTYNLVPSLAFFGNLDDIRIYNRALTNSEILLLYNEVSVCPNQPPIAVCQDVSVSADNNCAGNVTPEMVDDGSYDPDNDPITLSLNPPGPYPLGSTTVTLTVTDNKGANDFCTAEVIVIGGAGTISGTVAVNSTSLAGVTVKLLDDAYPTTIVDEQVTDPQGNFSFTDVPTGSYQVMIVEPLGYSVSQNFIPTDLSCGSTNSVDFDLSEFVLVNNARSKGYWKHQFDVYVDGKGHAQESESNLQSYLNEVINRYNPHFNIFTTATDGIDDFEDWHAIMSVKGNAGMAAKATSQLGALLLNMTSLKIAQYEEVTADGRTAGDVLTIVSDMLEDADLSNDELAKDLAEQVNLQQTIDAGIVPAGGILYKGGEGLSSIDWGFGIPKEYALHQNYPNPFNPTTTIRFALPKAGNVQLEIYNVMGQKVGTLVSRYMDAGNYSIQWDSKNYHGAKVSSGIYMYKIQVGEYVAIKKMILTK